MGFITDLDLFYNQNKNIMTKVIVSKSIGVSADKVWKTLSSFRGIEKYSPIERSETIGNGAGAKRTCYMPDESAIHEVLNFADDSKMEMQYKITQGPFPITDYVSDIKVSSEGANSCNVNWSCSFSSSEEAKAEMENLFSGFYNLIIGSLEEQLAN